MTDAALPEIIKSISIIIPTFCRARTLRETLNVLSELDYPEELYEVIVVDDGSTDDTSKIADEMKPKFSNFIYYCQKNSGAATARNQGVKLATKQLLLFIDDDMLLSADSLKLISEFHQTHTDCLLSGSRVYSRHVADNLKQTKFGNYLLRSGDSGTEGVSLQQVDESLYECDMLASFCLSMTKEAFERVGGFNENFPYAGCEDQEFTLRAINNNLKLYYSTDIKTFHNDLQTGDKAKWLKRQYNGVQGFLVLCELFPERKQSSLFSENNKITGQDNLKLKLKKIFKKIAFGKIGFNLLDAVTKLIEKTPVPEAVLNKSYSVMGGMMLYQGFKVGRKNLQNLEKK